MPDRLIFDTHAHYTATAFGRDRDELLAALPGRGVALVVNCGTDLVTSQAAVALAERYDYFYAAAGIHPESLIEDDAATNARFGGDWRAEMAAIAPLHAHPKVVAVGEVGLDHHWPVPAEAQLALFEAHIRLALELDLPLIVHDREAHAETYALLKKYRPKAVLHAYSGSAEDLRWLCAQGIYIGFTGVVTFKNARRPLEAAAAVPDEYLLLETDCPYMAPEPVRGTRNDSRNIVHVAAYIGTLWDMDAQAVLDQTAANARACFGV